MSELTSRLNRIQKQFLRYLKSYISDEKDKITKYKNSYSLEFLDGIEYSIENGGKRIRPFLVHEAENFSRGFVSKETLMKISLAIELIHSSTLVHDDLPGLDNDVLRRGKDTTHVKYGVGGATLIGDAMCTMGIEVLMSLRKTRRKDAAISYILQQLSTQGVLLGQYIDIKENNNANKDEDFFLQLYSLKTSSLFKAAFVGTLIYIGAKEDRIKKCEDMCNELGILFQLTDDRLGVFGDENKLGKSIGQDRDLDKLTLYDIYKEDGYKVKVSYCSKQIKAYEAELAFRDSLISELVDYIVEREC